MSATTLARELVVAQTRALKLPGVARTFEALARQARDAHRPRRRSSSRSSDAMTRARAVRAAASCAAASRIAAFIERGYYRRDQGVFAD